MRKADFTKPEWKRLRTLADHAYERELAAALGEVVESVEEWRARRINSFDLSDRIHEFHDGAAREIWTFHNGAEPPYIVAGALQRGFLQDDEVPATLRGKLRGGPNKRLNRGVRQHRRDHACR